MSMIYAFLIGLLGYIIGWVAHRPVLMLNGEAYDYLVLDIDGEEYEVKAR